MLSSTNIAHHDDELGRVFMGDGESEFGAPAPSMLLVRQDPRTSLRRTDGSPPGRVDVDVVSQVMDDSPQVCVPCYAGS